MDPRAHAVRRLAALALAALLLGVTGCSGAGDGDEPGEAASGPAASASPAPSQSPVQTPAQTPAETPTETPAQTPAQTAAPRPEPPALAAYFDREWSGGGLRLGAVRERTPAHTSYDVTYRSQDLRISGVLNVPTGPGPFPAVVLAHGYIDPAYYVRGQGMTRERGSLAAAGYIALHVDYRNHAESSDDPAAQRNFRTGYAVDVINAVHALRAARGIGVDDDALAVFGRSMGGGVVYKVLEMAPGLVDAGIAYSSVSTLEAENFDQFSRDGDREPFVRYVADRWGLPGEDDAFWRSISARSHLDRITEPVLAVHGRSDSTCPPRWARETHRALQRAGGDSTLAWYDDEHAFGPAYTASMERIVRFLDRRVG